MSRLKLYLLLILSWFILFYNMERLIDPINLASFVYVLGAVYALFIILFSPIYKFNPVALFAVSLVPYFVLKVYLGYPIAGPNLPLTVTEIVSIAITMFLSWNIGYGLETLRGEILRLTIGSSQMRAYPFQTAQAEFYREIRRARHYNRPAAILSIAPVKESVELSINRFIQEAQNNIIRQYIVARTADVLRSAFKETDVVTMRNDHFLVLLPETQNVHLPAVINRIKQTAEKELGLNLMIGASTFPDDALTFESLVESAEKRMKMAAGAGLAEQDQPLPGGEYVNADVKDPEFHEADPVK